MGVNPLDRINVRGGIGRGRDIHTKEAPLDGFIDNLIKVYIDKLYWV